MKMFYEHIIPAVLQNDEESVLTVLKAFQFSNENSYNLIINCFEAALPIYFLNPGIVEKLWPSISSTLV